MKRDIFDICLTICPILAAMSSSRSDVGYPFVRSFICPFVPFFSLSVLGVLFSPNEFPPHLVSSFSGMDHSIFFPANNLIC